MQDFSIEYNCVISISQWWRCEPRSSHYESRVLLPLKREHGFLLRHQIVSAEIRSRYFARFLVTSFAHISLHPIFDACVNIVCHFAGWTRNNTMAKGRKKRDVTPTAKLCHYRYRWKLWQCRNNINFSSAILRRVHPIHASLALPLLQTEIVNAKLLHRIIICSIICTLSLLLGGAQKEFFEIK